MKLTETKLREIIREILLNEEEYDYWRDYKSGAIDKKTYDSLVKRHQSRVPNKFYTKVYLNIHYRDKDKLKQKHGKRLRWDPNKKQWYYTLTDGKSLPKDLERYKK